MTTLCVTWLGQAGFIYRFPSNTGVCVDPYLSYATSQGATRERLTPVLIPPSRLKADIIVTTHDHTDHFDEHTLRPAAERTETLFVGPTSCKEHWLRMALPAERFLALDRGQSIQVADVELSAVYAKHHSGDKHDAIGIVLDANGFTVYQVGDSEYAPRLIEEAQDMQPDLFVVPINGRWGNMNALEAAQLTAIVQPSVVIPMHYRMFRDNNADPQDFVNACRELDIQARVVLMKPGKSFVLHQN